MKKTVFVIAISMFSSLALADWQNPDLYSGHGAQLRTNSFSNFNDNPDLYGNGYGEDSGIGSTVGHIDFSDPSDVGENPDLLGGV